VYSYTMRHVFYIWSVTWRKRGAVFKLKIARTATATPRHWNALTPSRNAIVFFITQSLKRDGGMTTGKVWKPLLLGNGGTTFDLFFKSLLQYWFRQARWCTDSRVKKKKKKSCTIHTRVVEYSSHSDLHTFSINRTGIIF